MLGIREVGKKTVDDVPIIREYQDVIPENLPGLPPAWQGEFWIDLALGATPIAKAPYWLSPPEMQELST